MKNLKHFALLAFVAMTLASCNKDDDNNNSASSKNAFTYDGKTYELKAGIVENFGSFGTETSTDFYVSIVTTEVQKNSDGNYVPNENKFSAVSFDLYSSNSDDIKKGTYNFSEDGEASFDFYGECVFNIKYNDDNSGEYFDVTSGSVAVLKTGNPYELKFDLTLENGKKVSGYFKGSLEYEDYSDEQGRPEKANPDQKHRNPFAPKK